MAKQKYTQLHHKKAQNLLKEQDVKKALRFVLKESIDSLRELDLFLSSTESSQLMDAGIITEKNEDVQYYLIRNTEDAVFDFQSSLIHINKGTYDEISEGLEKVAKHFQECGDEFPDIETEDIEEIPWEFLGRMSELGELYVDVKFSSDNYPSYDIENYGLPLVVRSSKKFKLSKSGKKYLEEENNSLKGMNISYISHYHEAITSLRGFARLSTQNMQAHRTVFEALKGKNLTSEQIGSVFHSLEEAISRENVSKKQIIQVVERIEKG